jgi:hypothetical protein
MRKQGHNISNRLDPFEQTQVCVESQRLGRVECPCWLPVSLIDWLCVPRIFFQPLRHVLVWPVVVCHCKFSDWFGNIPWDYSISATILFRTSVVVHSKAAHRHRARR